MKNQSFALPDMDYFKVYPSPMFEAMFNEHISPINTTTTYYGPLLYWFARGVNALSILEIGMAEGWTTFFLASAAKDEGVRHGVPGMYYGCDIADKAHIVEKAKEQGVPINFIHKDSWDLVPEDFGHRKFDLIFQDGWHSTEYVLREFEILFPYLKDNGHGYFVMHDAYGYCEEAFEIIRKKYAWEYIRIYHSYGLAILRNMQNYDYSKVHWVTGPQVPARPKPGEYVF
jgi:SAM-dependent methyltransferase